MRYVHSFLFSCLFLWVFLGYSQNSWGDYHYMNHDYKKAISFFERDSSMLSIDQQRHLALSYWKLNKKAAALEAYTPVANSNQAQVEDYYRYAELLEQQKALAKEYRDKAYRLPWETPSLFANDSLLYKKRFHSSPYDLKPWQNNTQGNEFGYLPVESQGRVSVLFLRDQIELPKKRNRKKQFVSAHPIYNFYRAEFGPEKTKPSPVKPLSKTVNSFFQEGPGDYSEVNDWFYFTRSNQTFDKQRTAQLGIYRIALATIDEAVLPERLPFGDKNYSVMHPALNKEGTALVFSSDMPGGFGGMDLYRSDYQNGQWSTPENLGPDINSIGDEVYPYWHTDQFLFFSSNGPAGVGGLDLFMAQQVIEKRWEVFLLGLNLNSSSDDFAFGITSDQKWGYLSSNRVGGLGGDDIYLFPFQPEIKGQSDHYQFVPSDTLVVAQDHVLKNDLETLYAQDPLNRIVTKRVELVNKPQYGSLLLNANGSFWYKNATPEQPVDSFAYRLISSHGKSLPIWVQLERSRVEEKLLSEDLKQTFAPIYYSYARSDIQSDFIERVDRVVAALNDNPKLEIEVRSYTDCRGNLPYNLALSQRRTQAILDYVRPRIDEPERIFGQGYGPDSALFTTNYALVVGSFSRQDNAQTLLSKIKPMFEEVSVDEIKNLYRVVVKKAQTKEDLMPYKERLIGSGLDSWIISIECEADDELLQQARRTDFQVIQL